MSTDIVIVAAARTGVGKFGGTLAKTPAPDLGAAVITELLVAKQQHRVVEPRAIDLGEGRVINRSEVDAADFRAECRSGRNNVETRSYRHIEYGKIPDSNRRVEQA